MRRGGAVQTVKGTLLQKVHNLETVSLLAVLFIFVQAVDLAWAFLRIYWVFSIIRLPPSVFQWLDLLSRVSSPLFDGRLSFSLLLQLDQK